MPGPSGSRQPGEVPLSAPLYGATIGPAFRRFWRKYATFSGRAGRGEFWWWYLVSALVSAALGIVGMFTAGPQPTQLVNPQSQEEVAAYLTAALAWSTRASVLPVLWGLATFVGFLALSTRRLHDTNRSGWWYLIILVPLVGVVVLVVLWASASDPQGRRYDRSAA